MPCKYFVKNIVRDIDRKLLLLSSCYHILEIEHSCRPTQHIRSIPIYVYRFDVFNAITWISYLAGILPTRSLLPRFQFASKIAAMHISCFGKPPKRTPMHACVRLRPSQHANVGLPVNILISQQLFLSRGSALQIHLPHPARCHRVHSVW